MATPKSHKSIKFPQFFLPPSIFYDNADPSSPSTMKPPQLRLGWRISLSPFLLLLLLLLSTLSEPAIGITGDGIHLLSFRHTIASDPFSLLSNWNVNDDTPCNWRGITCSPAARVTALSLPNSRLRGSLSPLLGFLHHLRTLNLSSNFFAGSIPAQFFLATELRVLDFSHNLLSGELPERIGELQRLELLNLSGNRLAGQLPRHLTGIGNLTVISLSNNQFSGGIPSGLVRVRVLDLSSNSINGSLPDEFGGQSIQYLNISGNRISGEIPPGFGRDMTDNATLDFSYNNLTGTMPNSNLFLNQKTASFSGNPGLCGGPLQHLCSVSPSSQPTSSPAMAAVPKNINTEPAEGATITPPRRHVAHKKAALKPVTIAVIVAGDLSGIGILALVLLFVHRIRRGKRTSPEAKPREQLNGARTERAWSSTSTSSETKGFAKWSCLGKNRGGDEVSSSSCSEGEEERSLEAEGSQNAAFSSKERQNEGTLVTLDGEELDVEKLLKASAYILGASGPTILYKAVLEDGSALAVRRVGEGALEAERLKEFESQVRGVAKVSAAHPNLVRIRGFYWGPDEKLIIYEFVPNGSLANARYMSRKGCAAAASSSPCQLAWESRVKIAKGVARALTYLHDKKHVHGNLKPTNILLDHDSEPKVADFGLERLAPAVGESGYRPGFSTRHFGSKRSSRDGFQDMNLGATPSPTSSSTGCGSSPYHPPESLRSLRATAKWDVYSFGVVLLELLTGKVLGPDDAATWMAGLQPTEDEDIDKARVLRMADVAIRGDLEGKEDALLTCLRLGCSCVATLPQKRPSMKEALQVLDKLPSSSSSPPLPYF